MYASQNNPNIGIQTYTSKLDWEFAVKSWRQSHEYMSIRDIQVWANKAQVALKKLPYLESVISLGSESSEINAIIKCQPRSSNFPIASIMNDVQNVLKNYVLSGVPAKWCMIQTSEGIDACFAIEDRDHSIFACIVRIEIASK